MTALVLGAVVLALVLRGCARRRREFDRTVDRLTSELEAMFGRLAAGAEAQRRNLTRTSTEGEP